MSVSHVHGHISRYVEPLMARLWQSSSPMASVADDGRDQTRLSYRPRGLSPMRIRLFLVAATALTLAACSESSTSPRLTPSGASKTITCRSGYHIATRDDGTEYCAAGATALTVAPAVTRP
jgi:hypothetical protein